jgi:hypothetical protein
MSANTVQAWSAAAMALFAAASVVLALVAYRGQRVSEQAIRAALHALVSSNLITVPGDRSIGKTLLRFMRINRDNARSFLSEDAAWECMRHSRIMGSLQDGDVAELEKLWPVVFGKPLPELPTQAGQRPSP